jgi:hypothetical protein
MNMRALFTRHLNYSSPERAAWFLVWFTLPVSLKLNSISIILVSAVILISFFRKPFLPDYKKAIYLLPPVLFFLWHARELFSDHPLKQVWKEAEQMLALIVIPILIALSRISKQNFTKSAITGLLSALVICSLIMLPAAAIRFSATGDWDEFIYHKLATPLHTGAIYFSLYLLFALFNIGNLWFLKSNPGMKIALAAFLVIMLLLSASKLMIGLGIPLLALHYRKIIFRNQAFHRKWLILGLFAIFAGSIPFISRVQPLIKPNLELVKSESFKQCPEPNGLELRLIFLRFGMDIMNDQQAWATGVGMTGSQTSLSNKIFQHKLYTGTMIGRDTGYFFYNFHNQFMETMVRAGIPGLILLIGMLLMMMFQRSEDLFVPKLYLLIVIGFFFTESLLERQAGIVFFSMIYAAGFIGIQSDFQPCNEQN